MKTRLLLVFFFLTQIVYAARTFDVFVWQSWSDDATYESLKSDFHRLKSHGVKGVCFNAGFNLDRIRIAAQAAHEESLVFHAWIPCMLQQGLPKSWYAVNRVGQSALDAPAYVPYYTALDPNNPEVRHWVKTKYAEVANIPEVDFVQLDYIRYVDVILAKGLWNKYGLVMNEEYAPADYCYCDACVADFRHKTGIDIRTVSDPSKIKEWAQYRCDVITTLVNEVADTIHQRGKKISADVFPGPYSHAYWMVRQEWNKWAVDAVFPMNYNDFYLEPASWVGKVTRKEVRAMKHKVPVYSGLFICRDWQNKQNIADPEGHGLLPSEIKRVVRDCRKSGAAGICLFSASSMTEAHWQALSEALK